MFFCFFFILHLSHSKFSMTSELWIKQTDIPLYHFTRPFSFSLNEFILSNSTKFKFCPFQMLKYNVSTKKWHKFKIKSNEDPSDFLNLIDKLSMYIQSTTPDARIMDHHGINNVTFDNKQKIFYAITFDWNLWKVNLSNSVPSQQLIHAKNSITPYTWSSKSYLCNPYLNMINDHVYILTPTRDKYIFIPSTNTVKG